MNEPLPADVLTIAEFAVQKWASISQDMDPVATYDSLVDLIGGAILVDRQHRDLHMLTGLTLPQAQAMAFIQRHIAEKQVSPTFAEIAQATKSRKSNVHHLLQELQRKGRIKMEKYRARSIVLVRP